MRGVFDIVGPVMIGPSSSHTAGAVRLGLIAGKILGERAVRAEINLHGSFAQTYRGHGTDKALIAGIMGFAPDDERIRDALQLAAHPPVRKHEHAYEARVPWRLITELREALADAGVDWRAAHSALRKPDA